MKKALTIGAVIGASLGVIIFAGYAAAGWWVCTTLPDCPGHWLPYVLVFGIGVTIFTLVGAGISTFLRGMYNLTKVEMDDND